MSQIIIEANWLEFYLRAAWTSGWEAHRREPDSALTPIQEDVRKIALMAAGFNAEQP